MEKQTGESKPNAGQAEPVKKMGKRQMRAISLRVFSVAWKIFFACFLVVLLYVLIVGGYRFGKALFTEQPRSASTAEQRITVEKGQSAGSIGKQLEQKGIVASGAVFCGKALLFQYEIRPGTYSVSPSMTDREILELMSADASGGSGK